MRMIGALLLLTIAGRVEAGGSGCVHGGRSSFLTDLFQRPIERAATRGFGAYQVSGLGSDEGLRVSVSQPLLGHYTTKARPQAFMVVRELHAASAPDLKCRAVVVEPRIVGDQLDWSVIVDVTDYDPRFCGKAVKSDHFEDGLSSVTLSGCVASDSPSVAMVTVRFDPEPAFRVDVLESTCGEQADALLVVNDERRVVRAIALDATNSRPAWDHVLMQRMRDDFAGVPLESEFDFERQERVFTTGHAGTFLALQLYMRQAHLTADARTKVAFTDDGTSVRRVVRVSE